jgi:transposase
MRPMALFYSAALAWFCSAVDIGIIALARTYGTTRLEAACARGVSISARSVGSIRSILQNGLDRAFLEEEPDRQPPPLHGNIRGGGYFH